MEALRQPRCGAGVKVPADGISAVSLKRLKRIDGVALGLAHLLSLLVLHMPEHDDIFKRSSVKEQGALRHERVEPPAGLIHRLGNKLRRELFFK